MARRKPLVNIGGRLKELPAVDTVLPADFTGQQDSIGFDSTITWYYNTDDNGWTPINGTLAFDTANGEGVLLTDTTAAGAGMTSPAGLNIDGNRYRRVKISVTLITLPVPAQINIHRVLYATSGHGISELHRKIITYPSAFSAVGDTVVLDFDMENLTDGGSDWITSTITQLRIVLTDTTPSGTVIRINYVSVGRNAPVEKSAGGSGLTYPQVLSAVMAQG